MVSKRRSPYRHRVRAHKRKGKPVKSFLRGKGKPRQPRKYKHVDGWVRKKVVVRKPPVVKKPPKPRKPRKPRKVVVEKPPEVIPKVLTPEEEKRRKVLLDKLEVHKTNLRREMLASGTVRTFEAKTRHYKEYLRHVKLHNDTAAELNRLMEVEEVRPIVPFPLRKMQKLWRRK